MIPADAADHTRGRRVGVVFVALLLAALSLGAADAGGGAPEALGYWWRSPVLAADQSVPEGGLVVAGQPEGPLAVSALRFELDDPDARAASIHLTVDTDTRDLVVEEPLLYACPVEQDWEPAAGGDWADVPGEHCSPGSAAEGEIGEDGEYVFVVSSFIQAGEIDVMITPGLRGAVPSPLLVQLLNDELVEAIGTGAPWPGPPTVEGLEGSNFRVTFEPPDQDTLRTGEDSADESVTALSYDGGSEFDGGADPPADSEGFEADDAGGPGAQSSGAELPGSTGPDEAGPPAGGQDLGASAQPQTAAPPETADDGGQAQDTAPGAPEDSEAPAPVALESPDASAVGDAEPVGWRAADPRLLGALVLLLCGASAGVLSLGRRQGAGARDVGGLAQFARPRGGPPVGL